MKIVDYMTDRDFNPIVEMLFFAFFIVTLIISTIFYRNEIDRALLLDYFAFIIFYFVSEIYICVLSKPCLTVYFTGDKFEITKNKNEIINDIVNNNVFYDIKFSQDNPYEWSFYLTEKEYKTMVKCEDKFNDFKCDYLRQKIKKLKRELK